MHWHPMDAGLSTLAMVGCGSQTVSRAHGDLIPKAGGSELWRMAGIGKQPKFGVGCRFIMGVGSKMRCWAGYGFLGGYGRLPGLLGSIVTVISPGPPASRLVH